MRKKLPVGIENFAEFSKEDFYYVDKTMFIAELLQNWGKVNLFTRPRRFGKSLNMSMLKAFFEIGCDKTLFDGLKITRERELCAKYMGKFPVISISLKSVDGADFLSAKDHLRMVIGSEADRFCFLKESGRLTENEKEKYEALVFLENGRYQMTDVVLESSLRILSQLLEKHCGSRVILLMDEYDVPLDKAFESGYYDEMLSLIRGLLGNALKGNDSLLFAVLTGCLRVGKESIFTGLNNLKVHTITDARYAEHFGFTDEDVDAMLTFYGLSVYKERMREWYDGYRFGKISVYCPWDVVNYCDALLGDANAQPRNYWANTSGNAMVRRFIDKADRQTRMEIEQLIAGEGIEKNVNEELTYGELDDSIENLWSVLFSTGYLTQARQAEEAEKTGEYRLAIPNREIRTLFITQIREWFRASSRRDEEKLGRFCRSFLDGDASLAEELLGGYLWNCISIRDTASHKDMQENFYHGLLLGLLQYEQEWVVKSNAESGEGYSDLLVMTQERTGVVIELKYAQDRNLEEGCMRALAQIEEKRYDTVLKKEGMHKILKYGIAFYKKNCRVMLAKP